VEASATGADNLLPDMDVCADCHDVDDLDECATCHEGDDPGGQLLRIEDYSEKFSHERHLGADLACETCHVDMDKKETVEPLNLPTMVTCQGCHEERTVSTTCQTCHMPDDRLKPASHGLDFDRIHADLAKNMVLTADGDKTCATCHTTDFCQECHEGENLDRLTHPLNWAYTHALEAQSFETNCASCHFDQQFCADCHVANLVVPRNHTAGWAVPVTGGRHKIEAAADLQTCISCHADNAEQVCGSCHNGALDEG
jgi:hypothetical protein